MENSSPSEKSQSNMSQTSLPQPNRSAVKLTQTVQKGGCAAKVAALELRSILESVKFPPPHKELLIDGRYFDDAAIYQVGKELALVQTLDFFTPIVDSPRLFGNIAAANALSDVYAMGGKVKTAMVILAYPNATFEKSWVSEMLQGVSDKVFEARGNIVGGHTIDDDTLKLGLSVTGYVHPQRIWSNQGAKPGDVLILTKPLGTGTHTAALKRQEVTEEQIAEVIASMMKLNNVIDYLSDEESQHIHSATDITGFGLIGHALNMAKASQVTFSLNWRQIPIFERTLESLENGFLTKAHRSNRDYAFQEVDSGTMDNPIDNPIDNPLNKPLDKLAELLLCDPQTSGGLLLAVDPDQAAPLLEKIKLNFKQANIIGTVLPYSHKHIKLI